MAAGFRGGLASLASLASRQQQAQLRSRAIRLLTALADLLLTLSLTAAAASPAALRRDILLRQLFG